MFQYFFKLAFRNIRKYKINTLISILGLTVGLTSFMLIASYINHELSYNRYNKNFEQIYSANINFHMPEGVQKGKNMPFPLAEKVTSTFPEVLSGVRINWIYSLFEYGDKEFFEGATGSYVDNEFFEIFSINLISGDIKNSLIDPYTIVLTEKAAKKYFGDVNPVGKNLLMDKKYNLKVTAVIEDFPATTDLRLNFFVSMKTFLAINSTQDYTQNWESHFVETFFLLKKNSDYKKLNEKLDGFFDFNNDVVERDLFLAPLADYHLKSNSNNNTIKVLYILGIVAFFILVIACINFINLSIANAANRVKETSIKRIAGGSKMSLILQQIGESVLLSFIAFDLAYLLFERLLNNFNAIVQAQVSRDIIFNFQFILFMLFIAISLGFVSGLFPAIKISKIHPLRMLHGEKTNLEKAGFGKKGLVIFQYAVSIVLFISSIILSQQFNYIKNKDLGFNKEYTITCYIGKDNNESNPKLKSFRDEMLRQSGVYDVTLSSTLPFYGHDQVYIRKENSLAEDVISINYNETDISYFKTFGIEVLMKKEIDVDNSPSELNYCYLNEEAVKKLDFDDPLGEYVQINDRKFEIIGVCKNHHIYSLNISIPPYVIILLGNNHTFDDYNWVTIKSDGFNLENVTEIADAKLDEFIPENAYDFFNYGDSNFRTRSLKKIGGIGKLFSFFTIIAILIASMGIFGLVALTVKNKTKEIGIRKALGSSVFNIYKLIAQEYLALTILGNILAWFPAWYIISKILQDFAYSVDIDFMIFAVGFITSILLTLMTIAFHTIKAAKTNPVEALRYE